MGLKKKLDKLNRLDQTIDRFIERLFILAAFLFGAWFVWSMLSVTELGLLLRLGGSFIGAIICALTMWLFWYFSRLLM
ncbi:MAG: hypothetical protein AAGJ73_04325 [Pseudomonadota bacterium]